MDAYYEAPIDSLKGPLMLAGVFHLALFAGMAFLLRATPHEGDWGGADRFRWELWVACPRRSPRFHCRSRIRLRKIAWWITARASINRSLSRSRKWKTRRRCRNLRRISRRNIFRSRRSCWRTKLRRRRTRFLTAGAERRRFPTLPRRHLRWAADLHKRAWDSTARRGGKFGGRNCGTGKPCSGGGAEIGCGRLLTRAPAQRREPILHFRSCATERWQIFRSCNRAETHRWTLQRYGRFGLPAHCSLCRTTIAVDTFRWISISIFAGSKLATWRRS